ncbi:MAG TPA: hypothetical protein VGH53_12615 [Streptosporangiaceae bacterium]
MISTGSHVLAHLGRDRGRIAVSHDRVRQPVICLGNVSRRVAQPGNAGRVRRTTQAEGAGNPAPGCRLHRVRVGAGDDGQPDHQELVRATM